MIDLSGLARTHVLVPKPEPRADLQLRAANRVRFVRTDTSAERSDVRRASPQATAACRGAHFVLAALISIRGGSMGARREVGSEPQVATPW